MKASETGSFALHRSLSRYLVPLALVGILAGCLDTPTEPDEAALFRSLVTMGNSITAGYQSGGINDSTQLQSWAVMLADQMGLVVGTDFVVPLLAGDGCQPPYTNIYTGDRLGAVPCAGRAAAGAAIHNAAVPGAKLADVLVNPDPAVNPLFQVLLEGKTQMEVAQAANPSFAAVWIGSNEILGPALIGQPGLATSQSDFSTRYQAIATAMQGLSLDGALLIGIPNISNIPHLSPGTMYWVFHQLGAFPPTFSVHPSCASQALGGLGDETLVSFQYAFGVLLAAAIGGAPRELNCATDAAVLTSTEIADVASIVQDYNDTIERIAKENGWAYLDPNVGLSASKNAGLLPTFPNATGIDAMLRPFGDVFSLDGVHPALAGHAMIAQQAIDAINRYYNTNIPSLQ